MQPPVPTAARMSPPRPAPVPANRLQRLLRPAAPSTMHWHHGDTGPPPGAPPPPRRGGGTAPAAPARRAVTRGGPGPRGGGRGCVVIFVDVGAHKRGQQ